MDASIRIAPFLNVCVAHSDAKFVERLKFLLSIIGVRKINSVSLSKPFDAADIKDYDLIFLQIGACSHQRWNELQKGPNKSVLVVGVSDDCSGQDWLWAIKKGADSILLRPFYPHLLRPMLAHLVESPAARRCRVVQFPKLY